MELAALARWVGRGWTHCAPAWILGIGAALLGPACLLASPVGIVSDRCLYEPYMMSIWFLSSYFGAMVGLALLSETGTVLEELDRGYQLCLGALLFFGLGLFHGIAAVISMRTLAPLGGLTWSGALLCSGHWAVLGVFVLRTGCDRCHLCGRPPGRVIEAACARHRLWLVL